MPRKILQKDKEFQTSKKSLKEKNLTNEHAFTELTQPKIKKTIPTSTFKKKKGRKRAQTSLVTFELDEESIEYILGDDKAEMFKNLYEMTTEGNKLLFLTTKASVKERLRTEIVLDLTTEVLQEKVSREKLQEEAMKIIQKHVTDKIHPDSSVYIGNLFTRDEMRYEPFSFGTVYTPLEYFSQTQPLLSVLSQHNDEQNSPRVSPVRAMDTEFEPRELHSFFESRPESVKHCPFDDLDNSQTSSQKRFLFPISELQERHTSFYYSKIKDLNSMISCKLSLKFDKIAAREQTQDEEGIPSPQARKSPRAALLPELEPEKPKRKFEDIIFEEDFANAATTERTENDIFDTSVNVKDSREIMSKIKNLRFEVTSEMDMQPIIKKLKGPDTKRVQPVVDQSSKLNEIVLEYKAGIPGERQIPIQIFGRDIQKLDPNCYINDTIIQFYLKLIQSEFLEEPRKSSVYMYNTYLIEKLRSSGKKADMNASEGSDFEKTYNSVKKWTKDVDIFEKDFLFFPAHDKNQKHWSLFVVCYPQYLLVKEEASNAEPEGSTKPRGKPFMLYFDSFRVMDTDTAKLIALYLEYEVMHKKPEVYGQIKQAFNSIREYRMYQLIVPLQDNFTDCGVYILEFAERFLMNPDEILENIEHDRNKLSIFPRSIFKTKRNDIKNIIFALAEGNKDILKDYVQKKRERLEAAYQNPDNFTTINDNEFRIYLHNKFNTTIEELDARTRDRAKLSFLIQSHDQRMSRVNERSASKN